MDSTRRKIVAIGAHTGDPLELCGGTLAKHVRRGDDVAIVALTGHDDTNRKVWETNPSKEWVTRMRQEVIEAGAKVLGITKARNLSFDIPLVADRESFLPIIDVIRELKPDIVLTHHPKDDANPDHFVAASLVVRAVGYARSLNIETEHPPYDATTSTNIIYCANFLPASEADLLIDVTETIDLVGRAYHAGHYQKDPNDLERFIELFKEFARGYGRLSGVAYAEPFKYSYAYSKGPQTPEYLPFRSG